MEFHFMKLIIQAILNNKPQILIDALDKNEIMVNSILANQLNLMQLAAKAGHLDIVRELIARGASIDINTDTNINNNKSVVPIHISPLYIALEHGHLAVAGLLLLCGASSNEVIALAKYVREDKILSRLTMLREHYCDPYPHLFWAIQRQSSFLVQILIENNNLRDMKLNYAILCLAACNNNDEIATLLLEAHVPCDDDSSVRTPLYWAVCYENKQFTNLLIKYQANVNKAVLQLIKDYRTNHLCFSLMEKYTTTQLYTSTYPTADMSLHLLAGSQNKPITLSKMKLSQADYYELFTYGLANNNLIILQSLIKVPCDHIIFNIMLTLIKEGQQGYLNFLFAYGYSLYSLYQFLVEHKRKEQNLIFDYLSNQPEAQESFLYTCLVNKTFDVHYFSPQLIHLQPILDRFLYLAIKYNDHELTENLLQSGSKISSSQAFAKKEINKNVLKTLEDYNQLYQKQTPSYLLNLPDEIMLEIMKYLSVKDMSTLSSTCKHLQALMNPYVDIQFLEQIKKHYDMIKILIDNIKQNNLKRSSYFTNAGLQYTLSLKITFARLIFLLIIGYLLTYLSWRWAFSYIDIEKKVKLLVWL